MPGRKLRRAVATFRALENSVKMTLCSSYSAILRTSLSYALPAGDATETAGLENAG